jgi:hypothetical protein
LIRRFGSFAEWARALCRAMRDKGAGRAPTCFGVIGGWVAGGDLGDGDGKLGEHPCATSTRLILSSSHDEDAFYPIAASFPHEIVSNISVALPNATLARDQHAVHIPSHEKADMMRVPWRGQQDDPARSRGMLSESPATAIRQPKTPRGKKRWPPAHRTTGGR